jgi:hypothetical protein
VTAVLPDVYFGLEYRHRSPMQPFDDFSSHPDFVQRVGITILHSEGNGKPAKIGKITAAVVMVSEARAHNVSPEDVCEAHDSTTHELYRTFHTRTGDLRNKFGGTIRPIGSILYIASVEVQRKYRGTGVGLRAVAGAIERMGRDCYLVALEAHPILRGHETVEELRAGAMKLAAYWARIGFKPAKSKNWMWLDPHMRQPYPFDEYDNDRGDNWRAP